MGWDGEKFRELTDDEAKTFNKGPVFRTGEEVTLKGLTFTIVDIAPGQMKLKPKRGSEIREQVEAALVNG
jgi:hypothetical protein